MYIAIYGFNENCINVVFYFPTLEYGHTLFKANAKNISFSASVFPEK